MAKKNPNTGLWVGVAVVAAAVGIGAWFLMSKKGTTTCAPNTPQKLTAGTPVSTLDNCQNYTFGSTQLPGGTVTDPTSLAQSLKTAGWSNIQVLAFNNTAGSALPAGAPSVISAIPLTGYIANGTFTGPSGSPVVPLTVVAGTFTTPSPLATLA